MTTLAQYRPFTEVDRLFEDFFGRRRDAYVPPVDITEDDDHLVVSVDLPGLRQEDVEVTVQDGVLTVRGERNLERKEGDERTKYHRIERVYGAFARSLALPANVQADKIAATFRDGVLTVTVPKAETAKPRKIQIKG